MLSHLASSDSVVGTFDSGSIRRQALGLFPRHETLLQNPWLDSEVAFKNIELEQ